MMNMYKFNYLNKNFGNQLPKIITLMINIIFIKKINKYNCNIKIIQNVKNAIIRK
jgi:hypothetical protein